VDFFYYLPGRLEDLDGHGLLAGETLLNGQVVQDARTSDIVFDPLRLVSFVSGVMTLLPGDVILTGTPGGIGPMDPGATVEVRIEGMGTLKNRLV
jgi:2-keto-4-pentenoate hydratase/2-oxohepta-3-ene-1,7-dioic acid hydratase in catechol pathway